MSGEENTLEQFLYFSISSLILNPTVQMSNESNSFIICISI